MAVGVWSAVGALALALGPLLGGLISDHLSWGWIFFINVPVGIATLALGLWAISESRESSAPRRLDLPGVVLVQRRAVRADLLAHRRSRPAAGHPRSSWAGSLLAAALGLAFVVARAAARAEPMVAMSLFRERVFSGGLIALIMWAFGIFGIYFFTSLYLQNVLGFSPTEAGAAFVPMALLMAAGAIASERVARRIGAYRSVGLAMRADGSGHRLGQLAGRGRDLLAAHAELRRNRRRRWVDRAADRHRALGHAAGRGGRRIRHLQCVARGIRACSASP